MAKQKRAKSESNKREPDYEKLGRMLASVYEFGHVSKKRLFFLNLFRGIAIGLGSAIGATIVVALMLWLLSVIVDVPFIGPVVDSVKESLQAEIQ